MGSALIVAFLLTFHFMIHVVSAESTVSNADCPSEFVVTEPDTQRTRATFDEDENCSQLLRMNDFPYGYSSRGSAWCQFIIYENYSAIYRLNVREQQDSAAHKGHGKCSAIAARVAKHDNWDMCRTLLTKEEGADEPVCFENGKKKLHWIRPHLTPYSMNVTYEFPKVRVYCITRTTLRAQNLNISNIDEYAKNQSLACRALYQWPEMVKHEMNINYDATCGQHPHLYCNMTSSLFSMLILLSILTSFSSTYC